MTADCWCMRASLFRARRSHPRKRQSYSSPVAYMTRHWNLNRLSDAFHDEVLVSSTIRESRAVPSRSTPGKAITSTIASTRSRRRPNAAADLGIERFVLDDGWFGRRDDDTTKSR